MSFATIAGFPTPWTLSCEMKLTFFQLLQIYKISDTFSYFRIIFLSTVTGLLYWEAAILFQFNQCFISLFHTGSEYLLDYAISQTDYNDQDSSQWTFNCWKQLCKDQGTLDYEKEGRKSAINLGLRKGAILEQNIDL